jgi:hypothetical protein
VGRAAIVWMALGVGSVCVGSLGCEGRTSPAQPTPVCSIAITPASQAFTDEGGASTIAVATTAGCSWTASSAVDWLVITSAGAGTGPGSIVYSVRPNANAESRTGAVTVESQRHTVTQTGRTPPPCTFELDPRGTDVDKDAVDGAFSVSAPAGCGWSASSTAPWLVVTAGSQGVGPGRVAYAVARNTTSVARDAAIVVADKAFAVHQSGDPGVPGSLDGSWNGRLIDFPGGRTFQMILAMKGDRVTGTITGDGTGGGGFMSGTYTGGGPVHLVADFGDGKQYFDGSFDGPNRVRGTSTYNQRPPVYQFDMTR